MMDDLDRGGQRTRMVALLVVAALVLVLAPLPFWTTQSLWLRCASILLLAWWLPGGLLVSLWRLPRLDWPTASVLAAGLGLCWMILLALLVHWLPGPMTLLSLVAAYEVGAFLLAGALLLWRAPTIAGTPASAWGWFVALLLLALVLRLPGLGYQELHEDEVFVLQQAVRMIKGAPEALAGHAKGPGEIAMVAVIYRALGTVNEAAARLPFSLAGVLSVVATALLGRRLFSSAVGFWAGVLLAVNGFALGLSRIVQYQPAVLLLSALAVLCAWEFAQRGEGRWLALAATYSAFGIVVHYEFGLLAPALLALAWTGWRRAHDRRSVVRAALLAGVAGTILVLATHLPILLGSKLAETEGYLGNRLGSLGAFNLPIFVELGTFYNSTYFFVGLVLLVLVGLVLGWRLARRRTLLLLLWFTPFLVLYLFVVQYPGTHFYLLMESWSLLAALPLAALVECGSMRPVVRWGGLAVAVLWLGVSAGYLYLVFFQRSPEYVVNYEEARLPFYWAPYGENVPQKPWYGIPIQQGWKTVGILAEWGYLGKTWASNERTPSLEIWYTRAIRRLRYSRMPDYIYVAKNLQKPDTKYTEANLEGYQRVGEVQVGQEPRIEIWAREPLPVPYVVFHSEEFVDVFDRAVPALGRRPDPPPQAQGVVLGDSMVMESASLVQTTLAQGDVLHLLLVWRPQQALVKDYKLFVHLAADNGHPVAQWDGFPCLNTARTSQWVAGETVRDHVVMTIPKDMPGGKYTLLVGLYDGENGERLGDKAIRVTTVTIR